MHGPACSNVRLDLDSVFQMKRVVIEAIWHAWHLLFVEEIGDC